MNKILLIIIFSIMPLGAFACFDPGPSKPQLIPKLISFFEPSFSEIKDPKQKAAKVKVLLNLSGTGKVTKYTIIDISPEWLDKNKIENAISKSRFHIDSELVKEGVEDFIYVYEFDIKTINKAF